MKLTYAPAQNAQRPVAIVTGVSRAQGIGAATTKILAGSGVSVFATGWKSYDALAETEFGANDIELLLEEIRRDRGEAEWISHDLSDPSTFGSIFDQAETTFGPVSILVNNAAFSLRDGWEALTPKLLDDHYAINQRGTAMMITEFARRWPGGQGGRVVNLSSGQFKGPMLEEIAYIATKGAIEAMTITFAAELAPLGITVNAINPGPTDTGWMTEELEEILIPKFPFGRIGKPEDAARLIAILASEQAEWLTGQIIHSEGGFLRQ